MTNFFQRKTQCLFSCLFVGLALLGVKELRAQSHGQGAVLTFRTFQAWQSPRHYYFFEIGQDRKNLFLRSSESKKDRSFALRLDSGCSESRFLDNLLPIAVEGEEILISDDQRWLALRARGVDYGSRLSLRTLAIEAIDSRNSQKCVLRASLGENAVAEQIPNLIFSDAIHNISNMRVQIREEFMVARLRYRVEASTRFRRINIASQNFLATILGAKASARMNGYANAGADFQILQSIKSFGEPISLSEWALTLGTSHDIAYGRTIFIFKPHLGFRQQLLLGNETNMAFGLANRSISIAHIGGTLDVEIGDRFLLRGSAELGFKEFERVSRVNPEWRYWFISGVLGYRLRPELRLLLESNFQVYKQVAEQIKKVDLVSFGVEMDF